MGNRHRAFWKQGRGVCKSEQTKRRLIRETREHGRALSWFSQASRSHTQRAEGQSALISVIHFFTGSHPKHLSLLLILWVWAGLRRAVLLWSFRGSFLSTAIWQLRWDGMSSVAGLTCLTVDTVPWVSLFVWSQKVRPRYKRWSNCCFCHLYTCPTDQGKPLHRPWGSVAQTGNYCNNRWELSSLNDPRSMLHAVEAEWRLGEELLPPPVSILQQRNQA